MQRKKDKVGTLFLNHKKTRNQGRFTLMLVPEGTKRETRRIRIQSRTIWTLLSFGALILVLLTGFGVYGLRNIAEESAILIKTQSAMNAMKQENEELILANEELNNKVTILSDTINQKVEEEAVVKAEQEEQSIPKGFPLSGTATVTEANANEAAGEGAIVIPMVIFEAAAGTNVIAAGDGTVVYSGVDDTDYGNMIKIDHGNGYLSVYRNAADAKVEEGDQVKRGTLLFEMNENTTKLGYEILKDDQFIEPLTMLEIAG